LNGAKLPTIEFVDAFLRGCGVENNQVLGDWHYVWRRLKLAEQPSRTGTVRRLRALSS
jgi:hypothetical protein